MKTFISKLVIAGILSFTLVAVVNVFSHIPFKSLSYRTASVSQSQPGPEILSGSYSSMINTLNANSGR
jgi:hypothetical protein